MTTQLRGTIIKTPDASPGLLMVNGRQKPFVIEGMWKSPVAPAVNMTVDAEFDSAGSIQSLAVVDPQQADGGKLNQISDAAQQHGRDAAVIARQGFGALVARTGKVTLAAAIIVWITWFFMPGAGFSISFLGVAQTKSFTLWDALSLDPKNNMEPGTFGFLNLVVIAAIVAPFAASFLRQKWARWLYAAPLACLVIAWIAIAYDFSEAVSGSGRVGAALTGIQLVPEYGTFLAALASLVVAARVFRRSATGDARRGAQGYIVGTVPSGNEICANPECKAPLELGAKFCAKCGTQRAPAASF
jgi:hypothetical protein